MKITYKVNENVVVEVEGDSQSETFKELAGAVEVFGAVSECGACQSPAIPRVRVIDGNSFHEAVCTNLKCRCVLALGANKKNGGLFPKRRNDEGFLPNNGWVKYVPKKVD